MAKKVMVIDDDRGIRSFLQKALTSKGLEAESIARGAVALQKLLAGDYDLVFIDINMPEISGPAICRALRAHERTRDLPVVMITAMFQSEEQIEQAKQEYGATDFLLKPFTVADLYGLIDRLFGVEPAAAEVKGFPLTGALKPGSLPLLIHELFRTQQTGLLHLQRGAAKKVVYVKNGYPVFVRSNILSECLGRMLVKEDVITQVDCDQSIERSKESGRLQGTVLIEMGLLTPQELHQALSRQVTEKLLSTFAWDEGEYRFVAGKDFKKSVTNIELSPAALILQGLTRFWTPPQVEEVLRPHLKDYLKQVENPLYRFQEMALSRRGETVFEECLGDLTLEQVLERHPLARREVQQVLAALLISGMIEASTTPVKLDQEGEAKRRAERPMDEELRRKILDDYSRIMQSDYFEALGLPRQCASSEARRAYYKLAKAYHPDRFLGSGLSLDMEHKIKELFQYITQAYSVLNDPKACSSYRDELINGPKQTVDVNQVIEAETAYQQGRALLKVRQFGEAAKLLKHSIELSPEEPEYLTHYAWAVFKSAPESPAKQSLALEVLVSSRELNPGLDLTHLYLGYVYQAQGKERQSEKSFEMAVQANPDCTEALRELRLINLRREQAVPSKGLFKKFLGKHEDEG